MGRGINPKGALPCWTKIGTYLESGRGMNGLGPLNEFDSHPGITATGL